ncbi:hypothetical protein [Pseudolabrys sp.]|uniref:hypothetical protein n=1 Tax=Pseudolabrys sp. TaxID=1960880 RepID=UPI003D0CEBCD
MSVIYSSTVKDDRLQKVIDNADAGSSYAQLVIGTSSLSGATGVLAIVTLPKPMGTKLSGVLTFAGTPLTTTATASGTAALAEIRDSDDVVICSGLTVGTSGTNVVINATAISVGQTITFNSGSITHG